MTGYGSVVVVIPTFNRRPLLLQALQSVVGQTYRDWRCTVVDNGSTDGTAEAVRAIGDPRVDLITHGEQLKPAEARNLALPEAEKADWVAFLDSDDLWAPRKLELQLAALAEAPAARWSCTACVHFRDFQVVGTSQYEPARRPAEHPLLVPGERVIAKFEQTDEVPVITPSVVAAGGLLRQAGRFDPSTTPTADWDYWLRLARLSPLLYLDSPLVAMRAWDGRMSMTPRRWEWQSAQRAKHLGNEQERRRPAHKAAVQQEVAAVNLAAGKRGAAAAGYARAAYYGRAPGQLAYALASLVYPVAATRRIERVTRATTPLDAWRAEAQPWVGAFREPLARAAEPPGAGRTT